MTVQTTQDMVTVMIDGFEIIRDPIYGGLTSAPSTTSTVASGIRNSAM